MDNPQQSGFDREKFRAEAVQWTIRRDRGLSAAESIEYELWLATDPRHTVAMQRSKASWSLLNRISDHTAREVLASASHRRALRRRSFVLGSLATALAIAALGGWADRARNFPEKRIAGPPSQTPTPNLRSVTLADGSLVRLNRGAEIVVRFTSKEREVLLTQGEAYFTVATNLARPFIVRVGALSVRAVGTAFNINRQASRVEVLVSEGRVQLGTEHPVSSAPPLLAAGEQAVWTPPSAPRSDPAAMIVVRKIDPADMHRALAWQDPMLKLGGSTLAEIAGEFERRSGHRVILADPSLAKMRVGGRFRADDLEGFVKLLGSTYKIEVDRNSDGAIVLRKKNPVSR